MAKPYALKNLDRATLEPVWNTRTISIDRIADVLGVSRQGLSYRARAMGLPSRAGNYDGQKKCSDDLFRRIWMAGVSLQEIADYCGYSARQNVTQRSRNMGLPQRTRGEGTGRHAGWPTISLGEFLEMELARKMGALSDGK